MTDDKSFRRLGRRDRKQEIKAQENFLKKDLEEDLPDLSMLGGDDDVAQLSSMPTGLVAKSLKIASPEQRYPPMSPFVEDRADFTRPSPALSKLPIVQKAPSRRGLNCLSLLALLGTVVIWGIVALIWQDPYSLANPLPPPMVILRITATFLPPTPTSIVQAAPVATSSALYPFALTSEGLQYTANLNGRGCEWQSIAGTVTQPDGSALNGYRVRVTGESIDSTVFSGTSQSFGAGGFEFPLASAPFAQLVLVQLFSPEGAPLSDLVAVEARATCEENVITLNFRQQ